MDGNDRVVDDARIAAARARGASSLRAPRATAARSLAERDRIEIDLASGWSVQVPRSFSPRLAKASPQECAQVQTVDSGLGPHSPAIDEDRFVPAVIATLVIPRAA